jgi:hypothetical protein
LAVLVTQLPEKEKLRRQRGRLRNTIGDIAQHVEARGRREIPAMGEIQIDVGAKIVDGAVLIAGDGAQRIPGSAAIQSDLDSPGL